jgi:hypothetical protein
MRIRLDQQTFEPWRIQALAHELADHPLLQLDALVELGKRQTERNLVRTHSADATAATSFADAPSLHPNAKGAVATLAGIADARAWMSLLNVQADPIYRAFIDEILDEVRPVVDSKDPGMCYRAGWIFVSSPNAVTPFHIDHEHNFIMQIRGTKRLYVWDPFDRDTVSERALERFHDVHSRDLVTFSESHRGRARIFDLVPGAGGYMPSTAAHLVENGPEPSITISVTYYTDSTRRNELLYRGNAAMRRLGIEPAPVGLSHGRDRVKHAMLAGFTQAKNLVRRAAGKSIRHNGLPYAPI